MTARQWFDTAPEEAVAYAMEYMNITDAKDQVWGMIRAAFASVSDLCVVPIQDFLELGGQARMNFPGKLSDCNWTWRAKDGIINDKLASRIQRMTVLYDRLGKQKTNSSGGNPA